MLDLSIGVGGLVKHSEGLSEFGFELNVVLEHLFNIVFVVLFVHVFNKVGSNLFSGGATHVAGHERSVFNSVQVLAVEFEVEVELEDPFLELGSVSMVKVRSSNLIAASLGFVRGIHQGITHLEGVQSVKIVLR